MRKIQFSIRINKYNRTATKTKETNKYTKKFETRFVFAHYFEGFVYVYLKPHYYH